VKTALVFGVAQQCMGLKGRKNWPCSTSEQATLDDGGGKEFLLFHSFILPSSTFPFSADSGREGRGEEGGLLSTVLFHTSSFF